MNKFVLKVVIFILLLDFLVLCKSFIYVFIYWVDFCGLFGYLIIDSDDCIYFFIRERKLKFLVFVV